MPQSNPKKEFTIKQMNELGKQSIPFLFILDFDLCQPLVYPLDNVPSDIQFTLPLLRTQTKKQRGFNKLQFDVDPVSFKKYTTAFNLVQQHICQGETYLLNLTFPSRIYTSASMEELYTVSAAPYKLLIKDQFLCFSPEIFVRIDHGIISSYPMKGTITDDVPNAEELICQDTKEAAEHHTIVDLIRNDLSLVAQKVRVEKLRYTERICTNKKDLLQVSSKITGLLAKDFAENIGHILYQLLPAGSITGAPKQRTIDLIKTIENYSRGYYTGVFGVFDGMRLDSAVMIRCIENTDNELYFKSGGGITFLSNCEKEYQELIAKIYVPIG
jgi:para-aminobenzoate synthetase component 1